MTAWNSATANLTRKKGAPLGKNELAQELDVSTAPVRESPILLREA